MNRSGFMLLELLVYVAVSVALCLTLLQWATHNQIAVRRLSGTTTALLQLHAAHHVITRDLRAASSRPTTCADCYVWQCGTLSVGVGCESGTLIRSEGIFDYHRSVWKQRTKSVLAEHCSACTLSCDTYQAAVLVTLRHEKGMIVECITGLRNRTIG